MPFQRSTEGGTAGREAPLENLLDLDQRDLPIPGMNLRRVTPKIFMIAEYRHSQRTETEFRGQPQSRNLKAAIEPAGQVCARGVTKQNVGTNRAQGIRHDIGADWRPTHRIS